MFERLQRLTPIAVLAFLVLAGFTMCVPFVWMISSSFKTRADAESPSLYVEQWTLDNYPVVLNLKEDPVTGLKLDLRYGRWYFNSIFLTVGVTLLQLLTSAMAAYSFARIHWPLRDKIFFLYLATIMIPGIVLMIPSYQLMVSFGFINTYRGLILPLAFTAFGVFLLRQYMISIPKAYDEVARIDGAGHWQIFWDIILPLSRPGLIAVAIITSIANYQNLFWPLIMLHDEQLFPIPVGLISFDTSYGRQTEFLMAATVMAIVPLVIIFVAFQRYLIKGIQLGGIKG